MRHVEIELAAPGRGAAGVYRILCDFERYPEHTDAVRSVRIAHGGDGRLLSSWEVFFRGGILRWTEEDSFDPAGRAIRFRQTEGDLDHFVGAWEVAEGPDGCVIRFVADFDLGIPALSALLEPIAERALREAIGAIVAGLLAAPTPRAAPAPAPAGA
ncbi:MAG TPA: SRPBCC family protein [Chloroflexota bacterium]|jgi:ribosome-associated toxin RatA of RatAB toxin-antitoxin module|nr:SRPBCC family protein [Chloroflexota bacterium]